MNKDTSKIVEELGLCPDFQTFYDENKEYLISGSLPDLLKSLLEEKGLRKADLIRRSELSEVYCYQIFSGTRHPDRKKVLCIALGLQLNVDETQTLLKHAGYPPLYVKLPFDSIVLYGLCHQLTVAEINGMLFQYGLETLG
jgi:hypothetical protein